MARTDETTIRISGEVAGLLDEAVAAGGYNSASDAIRDALLLRREQNESWFGHTSEQIDRAIDEADSSGIGTMTTEEILREGFRRAGVTVPRT